MRGNDDDTTPEEIESSENVPYMRRSRAVAVRRRRFPRAWRFLRWASFALFVLAPMAWGGYSLAVFVLNSPRFRMTSGSDVVVEGNHHVSRDDILDVMGVPNGKSNFGINVFRMSLTKAEKRIDGLSWIRSATIVRSYPHRLRVHISERVPVGFVDAGGQIKMVDDDGVLLDLPDRSKFDFPVLKGLDFRASDEDRKSRIALYREFMKETSDKMLRSGWIISEVNLSDVDDLQALIVQGQDTLLIHFGARDFLARFENFVTVLPELRKNNGKIDSVDLRYQNQVVVNPAEAGPKSSPTAKPAAGGKEKRT